MDQPAQIPPVSPAPMQSMPASTSPKKFLIPLAVALIVASAYVVYANFTGHWPFGSKPATPMTESPSPTAEPGTSEQPPGVSAVGTGTYTNKEFGFSFVIPAPLVGLEQVYPETVYVNVGTEKEISEIRNLEGVGYREFLSIYAFWGTPTAEGCADYRSTTPITIAGASGIKCTGLEEFTGTVDNETVLFRFFSPTEPNIMLQITSDQYTGANIAKIDQILATFKFTVPTAMWKTYTNTQYGFEVKYPPQWTWATEGIQSGGTLIGFDTGVYGENAVITVEPSSQTTGLSTNQIQHGGYLFTFSGNRIDPIRSTFKFTAPTTGWKTYTNTQYGFGFQYQPELELYIPPSTPTANQGIPYVVAIIDTPTGISEYKRVAAGPGSGAPLELLSIVAQNAPFSIPTTCEGVYEGDRLATRTTRVVGGLTGYACAGKGEFYGVPELYLWLNTPDGTRGFYIHAKYAGAEQILIDEILSTIKFTSPTSSVPADWKNFSSQYFTLSFKFPQGFEVRDQQNSISINKSPYQTTDIGSTNSFLSLTRYDQSNTRTSVESQFRSATKNIVTSSITVDGTQFTRLDGVDISSFEGDSAGRVFIVFFEQSALRAVERPMNQDQDFDPIAVSDQILATFRFAK